MNNIIIFTDGASSGNPGAGGFGAIIKLENFVFEVGGREDSTTNNRMEMKASVEALKFLENKISEDILSKKQINIYTDSSYLINGITKWVFSWQKNDWQRKVGEKKYEEVLNKDLWQELLDISKTKNINWIKVSGHSGIDANERCDQIAVAFSLGQKVSLFSGSADDYKISFEVKVNTEKSTNGSKNKTQKAYSYVSLVSGKIHIDKDWDSCKKRVSGVSNVKYKKSFSKEDEQRIIEEFSK